MSVRNSWESTCCPTPRDEGVRVRMAESQELVTPKDPIVCLKEGWTLLRVSTIWDDSYSTSNEPSCDNRCFSFGFRRPRMATAICICMAKQRKTLYLVFWLHRKAHAAFVNAMCISVVEDMSAAQGISLFFLDVLAQQSCKSSRNEVGYDDPPEFLEIFLHSYHS